MKTITLIRKMLAPALRWLQPVQPQDPGEGSMQVTGAGSAYCP